MENKDTDRNTAEAKEFLSTLTNKKISAKEFAENLEILFNDYFVCSSYQKGNHISITLLNGQKFEILVKK